MKRVEVIYDDGAIYIIGQDKVRHLFEDLYTWADDFPSSVSEEIYRILMKHGGD